MVMTRSEAAFTFLEMMLVLSVIVITFPIVTILLQEIQYESDDELLSVTQFFIYLQNDAIKAEEVYDEDNILFFKHSDKGTAQIEHYDDLIRRRVNYEGHEVYLRNVESILIQPNEIGYLYTIKTHKGELYEKNIYTPS